MTQIIGKNTLSGTSANWNTDAQCQMLTGNMSPILAASQQLTEYHFGYADVGGSGSTSVQVALYNTTSGFNGATLIAGTTQTITLDHDSLTGDQWVSVTGLTVDLSALEGDRVAVLLTTPSANGAGVLLETIAGADRNKSIVSTTPPATHAQSGTSTNTFALYAVTEDYVAPNVDPVLDTAQEDVTIQEGQTGTITSDFSDANLGDTLTYSISPDINLVTGFTFNTSTGSIVYDGSQAIASAISYTITCSDGNGGTDATDTFDLTVVAASLLIDSIDDNNPTIGDQITVGHSNALGTLTTPDFTISSQNGTEAVIDIPDITTLVLTGETYPTINFDEAVTITLSDGTNTADVELTGIQKPAGTLFAEITENNENGVYNPTPSIVAGMFGYFYDIVGNWVIDPATGLNAVDPAGGSFKYKIYNGEWGAEQTRAIAAETEAPVITLNGNASMVWVQGTPWVDPQATVTDNRDATRQISADSAPNINTPAVYTLNYNATDVAGNVATTVVRTVTVSGADVTPNQFNFVDVSNAELNTLYENTQQITGVDVGQTLTATNGTLSNDGGSTWSSSVQFVSGQTYVKASLTTTGDNSTANTVTVTVNGIQSTFTVTTKAAVTRTFTIGSSDAVVDSDGDNVTYTYPIWELWDKIPEDTTAVKVDSGVNFSVSNGVGSVQTSSGQLATNYIFIARDSGNTPTNYIRTVGQVQ